MNLADERGRHTARALAVMGEMAGIMLGAYNQKKQAQMERIRIELADRREREANARWEKQFATSQANRAEDLRVRAGERKVDLERQAIIDRRTNARAVAGLDLERENLRLRQSEAADHTAENVALLDRINAQQWTAWQETNSIHQTFALEDQNAAAAMKEALFKTDKDMNVIPYNRALQDLFHSRGVKKAMEAAGMGYTEFMDFAVGVAAKAEPGSVGTLSAVVDKLPPVLREAILKEEDKLNAADKDWASRVTTKAENYNSAHAAFLNSKSTLGQLEKETTHMMLASHRAISEGGLNKPDFLDRFVKHMETPPEPPKPAPTPTAAPVSTKSWAGGNNPATPDSSLTDSLRKEMDANSEAPMGLTEELRGTVSAPPRPRW